VDARPGRVTLTGLAGRQAGRSKGGVCPVGAVAPTGMICRRIDANDGGNLIAGFANRVWGIPHTMPTGFLAASAHPLLGFCGIKRPGLVAGQPVSPSGRCGSSS
jgi:hypothetical protein